MALEKLADPFDHVVSLTVHDWRGQKSDKLDTPEERHLSDHGEKIKTKRMYTRNE